MVSNNAKFEDLNPGKDGFHATKNISCSTMLIFHRVSEVPKTPAVSGSGFEFV